MPAPAGAIIKGYAVLSFQQRGPQGDQWFQKVCDAISQGWDQWASGLLFGTVGATGAGVGAWAGIGQGGMIQESSPFKLPPVSFEKDDPKQKALVDALGQAIPPKFTAWASSFKFTTVSYIGVSTATPINPGTVTAQVVPAPLGSAGTGQPPSGISEAWQALLLPPDWDLSNPQGKTKDLVDAISSAIEQAFQQVWLLSAQVVSNSVTGPAANGGVVANLASLLDGKIV